MGRVTNTQKVFQHLSLTPQTIAEIAEKAGVTRNQTSVILRDAALSGTIERLDSGKFGGNAKPIWLYRTRLAHLVVRKPWDRRMWNAQA